MEWIYGIGALLSLLGVGLNLWQTNKANKQQQEHDEAMAALNHRYREEEASTSFEREATFNQFSSDMQKMQDAGLSPALMYGSYSGNSTPQVSSVGSSQSAGSVNKTTNFSDFLGKLDPAEYAESSIQRMNARTMKEKTASDIELNKQNIAESISRTLENQRNTAFKKNLETTLFRQEQERLKNLQIGNEVSAFDLQFKKDSRELDMEKKSLENQQIRKNMDLISEKIKTEPMMRAQIAKNMEQIDASTDNYYANTAVLQESLKGSQLGRIMQECGLNSRAMNIPGMRDMANLTPAVQDRLHAASLLLQECGYSEYEANKAVLFYCAQDAKDVTPSAINGLSRIFSAGIKK